MHKVPNKECADHLNHLIPGMLTRPQSDRVCEGSYVCCQYFDYPHSQRIAADKFINLVKAEGVMRAAASAKSRGASPPRQPSGESRSYQAAFDVNREAMQRERYTRDNAQRGQRQQHRRRSTFSVTVCLFVVWTWFLWSVCLPFRAGRSFSIFLVRSLFRLKLYVASTLYALAAWISFSGDDYWRFAAVISRGDCDVWTGLEQWLFVELADIVDENMKGKSHDSYHSRDYLTYFLLLHGPRAFSSSMLAKMLGIERTTLRRRLLEVAAVLRAHFEPRVTWPRHAQAVQDGVDAGMCGKKVSWNDVAFVIIDGSGSDLYGPDDSLSRQSNYCTWKKSFMRRWFIVVTALGRICYVSPLYEGKVTDTAGMTRYHSGFYESFRNWVQSCGDRRVTLGGDSGYMYIKASDSGDVLPRDVTLIITKSAEMKFEVTMEGDGIIVDSAVHGASDFTRLYPHVVFDKDFQRYRSVVERVIGRLKHLSSTIAGPTQSESQKTWLQHILIIYCGILNRMLEKNKHLFTADRTAEELEK